MTINTKWYKFLTFIGCIVFIIGSILAVRFLSNTAQEVRTQNSAEDSKKLSPPFIHKGDNKLITSAYPGDIIYVWNMYLKPDTCHASANYILVDRAKQVVLYLGMFSNWTPEGIYERSEVIKIPEWTPPGKFNVLKRSIVTCNTEVTYVVNFDVEIEILKKK